MFSRIKNFFLSWNKTKTLGLSSMLLIAALVSVICVCSNYKSKIKALTLNCEQLTEMVQKQTETISELGSMDAIRCEVTINLKNTTVLGTNHVGNITQDAKQVAYYLRSEILDSLKREK